MYLTGWTGSNNFPTFDPGNGTYFQGTKLGVQDIFLIKFNNNGERLWSTYYGGTWIEQGMCIVSDEYGNIFVTGLTASPDFPVFNPGGRAYFQGTYDAAGAAYILKFTNTGIRQWATYFSGTGWDAGYSICSDWSGNIFLTGRTGSTNFPTFNSGNGAYYQASSGGGSADAYFAAFQNNGSLYWSTYYGGNNLDIGLAITISANGNLFATGYSKSTDFPTYNPGGSTYYQGTFGGGNYYGDAYIIKFQGITVNIQPIGNSIPNSFELKQNYPNPFNPITTIEFALPKNEHVTISVYDINGREISTPINNFLNAGKYTLKFNGSGLPTGIYFYQMRAGNFEQVHKMLLIK